LKLAQDGLERSVKEGAKDVVDIFSEKIAERAVGRLPDDCLPI
jgi:hypothetical protein